MMFQMQGSEARTTRFGSDCGGGRVKGSVRPSLDVS